MEKVPQDRFGALVARQLGRPKPITAATVSRWESRESTPDLATLQAVADLCGVDPGWLAFGDRSRAPAPERISLAPETTATTPEELVRQRALEFMDFELRADEQAQRIRKEESARLARWGKEIKALRAMPPDLAAVEISRLWAEMLDNTRGTGSKGEG